MEDTIPAVTTTVAEDVQTLKRCRSEVTQEDDPPRDEERLALLLPVCPTKLLFYSKTKEEKKEKDKQFAFLPLNAPRALSTFSPHAVTWESKRYPTVEHAFQAAKYAMSGRADVAALFEVGGTIGTQEPAVAKREGGKGAFKTRKVLLDVAKWTTESVPIMRGLIQQKVDSHADIYAIVSLLAENHVHTVHYENPGRSCQFWGANMNADRTEILAGNNELGKIYNDIIDDLRRRCRPAAAAADAAEKKQRVAEMH